MDKTIKICTYCVLLKKGNKGIEKSTNNEWHNNNSFHSFEDDTALEQKNECKMGIEKENANIAKSKSMKMKDKESKIRKKGKKKDRNETHAEMLEDKVDEFSLIKKVEALIRKDIERACAKHDELQSKSFDTEAGCEALVDEIKVKFISVIYYN